MPKIKITCTDPYATDSSSEDEESVEEEKKPKNGWVFVEEISVSVPIIIPKISTLHLDSLARLKSDSSLRVDESKSSADRPNGIVLALYASKPQDTPGRKSGRLNFLSMAQNCQVDATNTSSKEDKLTEASPTSINVVAAKNYRSRVASDYPGIHVTSSGKWGVRIRDPITKERIWLGSCSTLEEAINIYNNKKLEYADASFRVDESKSSLDEPNCTDLASTAKERKDTETKNSGILSVQNSPKRLCVARQFELDNKDGSAEASPTSIDVSVDTPVAKKNRRPVVSKQPGVWLTASGKWGVQMWDSFKKDQIWLGSYSTIEEATDVYNNKKLEWASLRSTPLRSKMFMQDASYRVDESKTSLDGPNCTAMALTAKEPEDTERKNSGIFSVNNRPKRSCVSRKFQLDNNDGSAEASPTSTDVSVDTPVAKKPRRPGASKHPGLKLTESGKWGVQIWDPVKGAKMWLGTYSTIEEATDIYNKKKLECASLGSTPLGSKMFMQDASSRVDELKSSEDKPRCIVFGLSATQTEETLRKKSDTYAKNSASLGPKNHPGLKLTSSGKWGAKIRDPIKRCTKWLGSYCTVEEATNAYNKKKLEYASMRPVPRAKCKIKGKVKGKYKSKELVVEGITVYETRLGKWRASFKDPFSNHVVWLRSQSTPEEAAESYNRRMLEFDPSYNCDSVEKSSVVHDPIFSGKEAANDASVLALDVAGTSVPAWDIASSVTNNTGFERPVLKVNETDKWRVAIIHPMLKCSLSLGLYDTPEEAAEVYNKKKLELEAVLHSDTIACPIADTVKQVSQPHQETLADVASPTVVKKYKGVKMTSSGRWMSQIQGPFSKKNKVYLGTFKTAKEASDTFCRTRREFDAIISLIKKRKHEEDSEGHKNKKKKKKHEAELQPKKMIILDGASMSDGERSRLFEIVVAPKINGGICEPIQENPAITIVSSQGSNNSNDNKQILGFPLAEHEFGADVIDSYGQLVGEYSRLDEDLWLSRPGEDEIFGGTGELAWDPIQGHTTPSLF